MENDEERSDQLATVTPIRPGISPGDDASPTARQPPAPKTPPADEPLDDDGTWGTTPTRRMRADDDPTATADAHTMALTPADTTPFGPVDAPDSRHDGTTAPDTEIQVGRDGAASTSPGAARPQAARIRRARTRVLPASRTAGVLAGLFIAGALIAIATTGGDNGPQPVRQAVLHATTATSSPNNTHSAEVPSWGARGATQRHRTSARPHRHARLVKPKAEHARNHTPASSHRAIGSGGGSSTNAPSTSSQTSQATPTSYQSSTSSTSGTGGSGSNSSQNSSDASTASASHASSKASATGAAGALSPISSPNG
jgi:hypothetical protein